MKKGLYETIVIIYVSLCKMEFRKFWKRWMDQPIIQPQGSKELDRESGEDWRKVLQVMT
jgi:hypothetical protein